VSNVGAQTVYTTKTGEKDHKETCKYLKQSKKEITLKKAKLLGYEACSVCKPTAKNVETASKSNMSSSAKSVTTTNQTQKAVAAQCSENTKSGSRCQRKTKNYNGKCYQHQS
tara:strand:+ start:31576 stop:31911 length:336 start_codon:yes stop_codon:yes gene_type:complete